MATAQQALPTQFLKWVTEDFFSPMNSDGMQCPFLCIYFASDILRTSLHVCQKKLVSKKMPCAAPASVISGTIFSSYSQLYQHIHWWVTFFLSQPVSWDAYIWSWWLNALVQRSSGTKSIEAENSDKDFFKNYLRSKQENVGGIHTAAVLIKHACGVWCADEGRLSLCVPLCFLVISWCRTHDKAVHSDINGPWKKNSWVEGFSPPRIIVWEYDTALF